MRKRTWSRTVAAVLAVGIATTGCGAGGDGHEPITDLRILVPNSPGSGYDTTARSAARAMEEARLAGDIEVFNVSGASGTVGLHRLVNERGNGDLLMQMGLGLVGAVHANKSRATLAQITPIARLIEEPEVIVVPARSPYQTLDQLLAAWRADPGELPVGGGSAPGGPDHLTPMLLAEAAGITPGDVDYVSHDGGGELLAALLGNKIAFAATGVGEAADVVGAGKLRALAVTSAEPVEEIDAPTLRASGIDLVFSNWRGLVAAPGITAEQKQALIELVTRMHETQEWKTTLERYGRVDAFATGAEFETFLESENERVAEVLRELGLT